MHYIRKVANASRYSYPLCSWAAAGPNKTKEDRGDNKHAALGAGAWSASWTEARGAVLLAYLFALNPANAILGSVLICYFNPRGCESTALSFSSIDAVEQQAAQ